jgi:hypothetical protein
MYWQIGKSVVQQLTKNNQYLTLVDVLWASMMPAGIGNNYFLVLKMADVSSQNVGRYQAFVWGVPQQQEFPWKVLSFQYVGN